MLVVVPARLHRRPRHHWARAGLGEDELVFAILQRTAFPTSYETSAVGTLLAASSFIPVKRSLQVGDRVAP